jgi:Fe-S-cluster containining protein
VTVLRLLPSLPRRAEGDAGREAQNGDAELLAVVDAACADAVRLAAGRLACRIGCTECCVGPFPITALDAARLGAGLDALCAADPERAFAVVARARRAAAEMAPSFPGDPASGVLDEEDGGESGGSPLDAFFAMHAGVPCPALDPASGRCELYAHRPISCRTFGPPMRIEGADLPPCRLCFADSSPAEVEAARGRLECHDLESPLERAAAAEGVRGDTLVAFALRRQAPILSL